MLTYLHLDTKILFMLQQRHPFDLKVYLALFMHSNVYKCCSYPCKIETLAKRAGIKSMRSTYRALSNLVDAGLLEKLKTKRGWLQYKFLLHTPAKRKGTDEGRPEALL